MEYLTNDRNELLDAAATATNIVASTSVYRTDTTPKDGNGNLSLTGSFTGGVDATFDVQIVAGVGTIRSVTEPVLAGVGSGTMTAVTADATVDEQTFTITLADLGTLTLAAQSPFLGVRLEARDTGADGNLITVSISSAGLSYADTSYSLRDDLPAGAFDLVGDEWDFGAVALAADGTVPDTVAVPAPRIRFGNDPQVYRPHKRFLDGQFVYSFSPRPLRNVQAGTKVRTVTGSRTVTITDGTTTDTLPTITTIYSLLAAINADSTLCKIVGPVVNDKLPLGHGITEPSLYTSSYIASVTRDGSATVKTSDFDITVAAAAPTERLLIECIDSTNPNAETWAVTGPVSGQLDDAITGTAYSDGSYGFTIPAAPLPPAAAASAAFAELDLQSRGVGEAIPLLCTEDLIVGSRARNRRYEFVWQTRAPDCAGCVDAEIVGGPDPELLGVPTTGGDPVSEQSRLRRLQQLTGYVREFIASNTGRPDDVYRLSKNDIELSNRAASIFAQALSDVGTDGTMIWPVWTASTAILIDVIREPTVSNGYRYSYSGGTTGASQPTWPTTVGATVSDGTGTWTNIGKTVFAMWDAAFVDLQSDLSGLVGRAFFGQLATALPQRLAHVWSATLNLLDELQQTGGNESFGRRIVPLTKNGHYYMAETYTTGITGGTEPTWPLTGGTVTDGGIVWRDMGAYWTATAAVTLGTIIEPFNGYRYKCTAAGTTSGTEPTWSSIYGVSQTDGTVTWTMVADTARGADVPDFVYDGSTYYAGAPMPDEYYERWVSAMNDVRAAAGLSPDFESAGLGNRIWRDRGGAAWFVSLDGLLPLQPGFYYHSARMEPDEFGNVRPVSTMEFGVGVAIACAALEDGDKLYISIDLAGVARASYQQGDRIEALVTRAQPLPLTGGQTGTDVHKWTVVGSLDGSLDDYDLSLMTPVAYSDAGLSFLINQGAIAYALGDQWTFAAEAGRFKWRKNAGSWSADTDIAATVSLSDGLSAAFGRGAAPSWVTGDVWTFAADAVNGIDRARSPADGALSWTGSTVIQVAAADDIEGILIADHGIGSGATITLTGSNDNFATTPLNQAIAWRALDIWHPVTASYAAYRITINQSGSIRWLWLGVPLTLLTVGGIAELGRAVRRVRLPGATQRSRVGATVTHDFIRQASVDQLVTSLSHACTYDDAVLAVVLHDTEAALVRIAVDSLEFPDEQTDYQADDTADRRIAMSLELQAVA